MDALLSPATSNGRHRFETRLAYGLPTFTDRLTLSPALAVALSPDSTTYRLLWTLAPMHNKTRRTLGNSPSRLNDAKATPPPPQNVPSSYAPPSSSEGAGTKGCSPGVP